MVRETRYLIVRNLPESCSEQTVIDHFQRYGKIQSVKLKAAKENGGTGTATVAFNDIKSAAKAHHANNSLGEATLRTDYWEGSTQTPVLVPPAPAALGTASVSGSAGTSSTRGGAGPSTSYTNPPSSRPVSSFGSWNKGPSDEDGVQDKTESTAAAGGGNSASTNSLDKSVTSFDIPRGRGRDRFSNKKKFGHKFEKSGSFGRHGTSSRSLEAARTQSEAAAAAAAAAASAAPSSTVATTTASATLPSVIASSSSTTPTNSTVGVTSASISLANGPLSGTGGGLINHPVIVLTDGKDSSMSNNMNSTTAGLTNSSSSVGSKDSGSYHKDSGSGRIRAGSPVNNRHNHGSRGRTGSSSLHRRSNRSSRSRSLGSHSRSRSRGSRSSSSRSDSSGTSRSTSPHRSFSSNTMRPQSMVGASRLVSSCNANDGRRAGDDSNISGDGERRSLGICVTGLPMRSSDSSLRDGLYHEYKKHGKVTTVQVFGEGDNRCAVVSFRKPEDASKALEASQGKTFFGAKIKVTSHEGVEVDDNDRASDNDSMDEYHQKSTRTLFVGNLEKETTTQDLIDKFKQFGEIIDVDIKRQGATTAFAFVQYIDITSVVSALKAMEGEHIGINKIKLGFGKSMPTCCVWLDNIPSDTSNRMLRNTMSRYGDITYAFVDCNRNKGLVCFSSYEDAQRCVNDIKQRPHFMKKKLQIDFASRECHTNFLDKMEKSGQMRAIDRPDESRVHKFRPQRSIDNFQDDGSPSNYGFSSNRSSSGVFNTPRSNGRSNTSSSRRSRNYDFNEENHSSSSRRSSRRSEDYNQTPVYKGEEDFDAQLREYGYSQRERRERDHSQSRRSSRDLSLDRYDDSRSKDRTTSSMHNSRDTSPSSEHNSYRYKYQSRSDRYGDDVKGDEKDVYDVLPTHNHRSSRLESPAYISNSSMHSHDSDYGGRRGSRAGSRGSRSQSPDVTLLDDHSSRGIFYSVTEDDLDQPFSSKSRSLALLSNSKLGAEVAKTAAEKGRKRTHEEISRLDKSSPLSSLEREKLRHLLGKQGSGSISSKRRSGGGSANLGSPGAGSSGGSQGGGSENGSAGEDLHHLHQRKQILLMQIKELSDEDSPGLASAKGKSAAVKDALRRSGRSCPDEKVNENRISARTDKLRRSEARGLYGVDDKTPAYDEERSLGGNHSDSDYDTERQRPKRRRIDGSRDSVLVRPKSYNGQDSVEVSDSEDHNTRLVGSTNDSMSNCDIRSNSLSLKHPYEDVCNLAMDLSSPCDNGDVLKGSDKDIHVINKQQSSSKLDPSILSRKVWGHDRRGSQDGSPAGCFSPSLSETGLEEAGSVTSSSLTEKSLRQPGSPLWKLSPSSSPSNQDPDLSYLKDYAAAVSDHPDDEDDDDCLSDSSIGKAEPPGPGPGDASWEERIREIDRILNMAPAPTSKLGTTDFSLGGSSSSCSLASNKDISTTCSGGGDLSSSTNLYAKFRRRPREESDVHCIEGGAALPEQPSVIVQRVLSKKSILDQDFKRLEQVNNKFDTSSSIGGVPQLLPPSSITSSNGKEEPQVSPRMLSVKQTTLQVSTSSIMPAVSPSLSPVTTSSSELQPIATTSVAGSTLALSSSSLLCQASSSAISATGSSMHAVTTSSVCTPISSISVSCENSGSKDLLDKHRNSVGTINSSNFTNKLLPHHTSSSLSTPMNVSIVTTAQLITASSSSTSLSSVSVLSTSMVATCSSHHDNGTSTSNTVTSSSLSKQCNSSSSLPPSMSISSAPCVTAVNSQASLPLSSVSSNPSTTTLASATAPITQDSASMSQLVPTVGQEAPILTPREVPTPTALCPHLPGDEELSTLAHPPATSLSSGSSELTINLPSSSSLTQAGTDGNLSKSGKSSALVSKSDVITPDIESPVSVKSGTSSTDSVPLSSLDAKIVCGGSETKSLTTADVAGESNPSDLPIKEEPAVISSIETEKGSKNVNDVVKEMFEPSKGDGICPAVTSTEATVLSVSIKDNEHKDEKHSPTGLTTTDKVTSFSPSSSSSNSVSTASDADVAGKPLSSANFSSSVTPTSSTGTASNKSSLDKADKKTPSKQASKATSVSKTDSLFSPDVKLEPPHSKSTSSTLSGDKAQSKDAHKGSSQGTSSGSKPSGSSSTADRKLAKSSKDSRSDSGSTNNVRDGDKEKKPEPFHKLHDSTSKGKESDKTKSKDKKDSGKEGEKSRKDKDEMKKKEEKKTADRKDEKKTSSQREEKKSEKKGDDKKDKAHEKTSSKQDLLKLTKSDPELAKKDKKAKEKSKENLAKDKSEKKLLPSLSCVAKNATPEPKSSKSSEGKDSKSVSKGESSGKSDSSAGKTDQKGSSKSESKPHKNDSGKFGAKTSDLKAESSSGDKGKKASSDAAQKTKKEGDKSGQENVTKVKKEDDRSVNEKSKKVSEGAHKNKKDGDKETAKQGVSKHSDKALKQKQKEEEKIKEKQKLKEKEDKDKREKEERERQKEKEREEREKLKEKERKEKEEKEKKEREEKERFRLERERREKEEKERREREEKEKQRLERERKEREEKERKDKEEKERLKREKEEREKVREKERQERERQKEKEREEKERQKEKEEKERKEKEENDRLKKEREEKEKAKQKEREEKERIEKEKREKEEKEKQRKEKEKKERKEKEKKKAKEEKMKKEKEAKEKKDKEEKQKKEKEDKGKKDKSDKEKKDKEKEKDDDKKKPPPPKKQKRNELAALLDSNDRFQMTFTSMYDRVKTQRNRESESGPNKSPSSATPKSSLDKFKQNRNKKGSKIKSSLYTYGSNSDLSDDDNMSETNESEDHSQKAESPRKEEKSKKAKQVKKRPHLSSTSSSSCEDDDDALLSVTKSKGGKKTDIFSSDSEDDSLPPPSVKTAKQASKTKPKPPAPKKKKIRTDSLDSVGSRDEFVKPQTISSVTETESFDDMDLSETELTKVSKPKKKKGKPSERRDSSVESVTKNTSKVDRDSSSDSVTRKPLKTDKDQKSNKVKKEKKNKIDGKKAKQDVDEQSLNDVKMHVDSSKRIGHKEDLDLETVSVKAEIETDQENSKADIENLKSKDKNIAETKSSEKKKKKDKKKDEDREDGLIKKKKKKKYDPKEEEALVNSLLTKMYENKSQDKEKKKKKPKQNIFDIESDDLSLSETSLDISHEKKPSVHTKEELSCSKQKDKKQDKHEKERELQTEDKQESLTKHEPKPKEIHSEKKSDQTEKKQDGFTKVLDKLEQNDKRQDHHFKRSESSDKKQHMGKDSSPTKEKLKSEENIKTEFKSDQETDRSESGKPPKKKKKKDHEKDIEKEKKSNKSSKNILVSEKKSDGHKEEDKKSETKTSQKDVDEFTSFWGHPKPILIPKRLKDSKKPEDDTKSKESKEEGKLDQAKQSEDAVLQVKEEDRSEEDKGLDGSPLKTPDSITNPKVESDTGDDFVVPISEAETTVFTENGQQTPSESASTSDSLMINEEQTPESDDLTGDMTTIGSSVEINDDEGSPSLVIDEVPDTSEKKKTKKEKRLVKEEKEKNDRLDEVIARVAMGGSSDEEDGARQSPGVNLQDVIDEELKYDNKSSNEPDTPFIVSDFVFSEEKKRKGDSDASTLKEKAEKSLFESATKGEPEKKGFLLDEETKKRDEDLLKKLAVLCDPSADKPVEIEDPKAAEEARKKKEEEEKRKAEEEKRKAEEEKKKAEEEAKARREREEKEASDEAARAVESLLEFQSGFDDDLPPLFIEPAEKEPPVESVSMSPSKDKSDVSIFPGSIPEKVTANLDDKLLERKSSDGSDTLGFFTAPSQSTHVPVFPSPRRNSVNSVGLAKDKTPEPGTMTSPQRQMRSPQRQQMQQSPQLQSPQHRSMPSPQMVGPGHHSSPQKIQSPQTGAFIQSPQHQIHQSPTIPSPQRSSQSLQSPLLSPQRSPFFKQDRNFLSPVRDNFPQHEDGLVLAQQPQRRASSGLPTPPAPEHALDPHLARRKSQELPTEQAIHSPRRNTIATPDEAVTSVAHLDRRFPGSSPPGLGSSVFLSKERPHSSLPQPVSISLDNAPHDKNFQSPVRSLNMPPHQENALLSPKRGSPGFHHKEQHSLDPSTPFQLFQSKQPTSEQIFQNAPTQIFSAGQQHKGLSHPETILQSGKGLLLDKSFKPPTMGPSEPQNIFRASLNEKLSAPQTKEPPMFHYQKNEILPFQKKELPQQLGETFTIPHNKPTVISQAQQQEPMFSPKTQPSSPYTYPDVAYDFLNSPPPSKIGSGLGYPITNSESSQQGVIKSTAPTPLSSDAFSHDPLFIAMSEASSRPPDKEPPPPRRQGGLPPSFYQEPVPTGPKFHQPQPELASVPHQFDDNKTGRKRKRSKKQPKEDKEAALKEQAIQEIVQSNVEHIHQAFNATQAKAAAEKAGTKKAVDAYDFEAHTGQETVAAIRPPISDLHTGGITEDITKPQRMRNEGRGRGRGRGGGRGRRGRGGGATLNMGQVPALQDKNQDALQRPMHMSDPFGNQRRPGPDFLSQQQEQQQRPPTHQPESRAGLPPAQYPPPVSHHNQFPPNIPPFVRPGAQQGFNQPFFPPQNVQPEPSTIGGHGIHDPPNKQQQPVAAIPTSSPFLPHASPMVSMSSSAASVGPPAAALPASSASTLSGIATQPQQAILQMPPMSPQQPISMVHQKPVGMGNVLSPEASKQQTDLDSSFGESELVINLEDEPASTEGKENQCNVGSDSEEIGAPRNQRATRARRQQPNYKAIAHGTAQATTGPQGRGSRSVGSPRGARGPPGSPKSSSPVVKLEKLEVARTTRRGRKDDLNAPLEEANQDEDKFGEGPDIGNKPIPASKESIYDFADNESDPQREPASLRASQPRRNKKRGLMSGTELDTNVDLIPESPLSVLDQSKPVHADSSGDKPSEESGGKSSLSTPLSNVDAVIEAVAKGQFGDEEGTPAVAGPTSNAEEDATADPAISPPHTRSSRRAASDAKKDTSTGDQKQEKTTFSIAEAPRFDGTGTGKKGPTVPPLRIKVAHGTPKVEKEKHYVIATEQHPQKPLSLTVKVAKSTEDDAGRDLGLFSGLPQGETVPGDLKTGAAPAVVTTSPTLSSSGPSQATWKSAETKVVELSSSAAEDKPVLPVQSIVTTSRAGGALHPKVAAKVASQEAAAAANKTGNSALIAGVAPHPSLLTSKSSPLASPAHIGPKQAWAAGHHLEQLQQQQHHQRLTSPGPHSRGMALPGINSDLAGSVPGESQKHHQAPFGFPGTVPAAHGGTRSSFLLRPEAQGHGMVYAGKSPSQHGRTRTPPVTSAGMLYSGVVAGMPLSLSPKSASPEGQVIERLPNPVRQGEQSPSPLGLRLPGSHHPEPSRYIKGPAESPGCEPPPAHVEQRAPSREMSVYQHMMEQQRLQEHLLRAHAAAADGGRTSGPPPGAAGGRAGGFPPPGLPQPSEGPVVGGRKGSVGSAGQPLNLAEQEPKSTPPAPQSPFPPPHMPFMEQRASAGAGAGGKPGSAFMQPGHPAAQHLYPGEPPLGQHGHFAMMGRLPLDPRTLYSPGGNAGPAGGPQQHLLREGLPPSAHFPPFQRSPSQSPNLARQLPPSDLVRLSVLGGHDLPARDSPGLGILQRYPVMWQGGLALKNESSYVQMHFIAGNRRLPSQALPQPMPNGVLPPLRISQRMRLETTQLDGVAKRMQNEEDYCILIAVACGRDEHDISHQTRALSEGFITYLLSKQAAGIVNVPFPDSEQAGFVVHIFPPCEFVDSSVSHQGSEALMEQLRQIPHAVIIIATTFT